MARIAVGGIQHETNVFAPTRAEYAAFAARDEWPPLCRGDAMLSEMQGMNLPANGGIERLRELGHDIVPLLWCSATPSAHVTEEAFETIAGMMLSELQQAGPVDGVLLDLHGAMVCTHVADGDGELLRRFRDLVGEKVPVVATLDLHANISEQMATAASVLESYRTYPHVDMADTGVRAADLLELLLQRGLARFPATALRRTDFLIPPVWGCTLVEPAASIYDYLPRLLRDQVAGLSLTCGFPLSDVTEVGPALIAYGFDQAAVDAVAEQLLLEIQQREAAFRGPLYTVEEAVTEAMQLSAANTGPVILADSQDNPGGGGTGDTTEILQALVAHAAEDALVGVINDAAAAQAAHRCGPGNTFEFSLGGKSGIPGSAPFNANFRVLALSDGCFEASGPMFAGAHMDLGPSALLEVDQVRIVVGSKPMQTMDQSMFRHLHIEPAQQKIIALKSSIHFRNDFQNMSAAILSVVSPGAVTVDLRKVNFKNPRAKRLAGKLDFSI